MNQWKVNLIIKGNFKIDTEHRVDAVDKAYEIVEKITKKYNIKLDKITTESIDSP